MEIEDREDEVEVEAVEKAADTTTEQEEDESGTEADADTTLPEEPSAPDVTSPDEQPSQSDQEQIFAPVKKKREGLCQERIISVSTCFNFLFYYLLLLFLAYAVRLLQSL